MTRPVLVGMNNPLSDDPEYALFPYPVGSTGHRIYSMLQLLRPATTRGDYCRAFDRRNVLNARLWSDAEAKVQGARLRSALQRSRGDRVVVVFGAKAWQAMDLPAHAPYVLPCALDGVLWRRLPHPSGRGRWYNETEHRLVLGLLLEELIDG